MGQETRLNLWSSLLALLGLAPIAADSAPTQPKAPPERFNIDAMIEAFRGVSTSPTRGHPNPFRVNKAFIPPQVGERGLALDETFSVAAEWAMVGLNNLGMSEREGFIGYQELALLATRPEYRSPVEIIAEDATSEWIEVQSAGEDKNKSDTIKQIEDDLIRFDVRTVFKIASQHDGFFGRAHISVDLGVNTDLPELMKSIADPKGNILPAKVGKDKLEGFLNVEPVWAWPQQYNSLDPLSPDWYRPRTWLVMSKEVSSSRILTLVARPVPDLLKAAYMFGGLSSTQMMRPVVENWLKTRKSVGDAISNFSTMVLMTNMVEAMNTTGSSANVIKRAELYNLLRDNRGLFLVDKVAEDFKNVAMPLSGLSELQGQSQEHMCSLLRIPVIRLLGIQPAGLNASSEGEIAVYKQSIKSYQEFFFRPALTKVLQILQCNRFGKVDPDIVFTFKPLESLTALEKATLEKVRAETATIHIQNRTVSRQEERQRIASDPDTPYDSLDVGEVPEMEPDQMATVAQTTTAAVVQAFTEGLTDRPTALRELQKLGELTGVGSEITDELIAEAEEEPPTLSPEDIQEAARAGQIPVVGEEGEGQQANGAEN